MRYSLATPLPSGQPGHRNREDTDMLRTQEATHVAEFPETDCWSIQAWQELLEAALSAIWPTDQRLEEFLDQYERLP